MEKYEWLNTDYILAKVNWHMSNHAYELIKPDPARGICYEEGTFWLIDLFGMVVLQGVDLSEFSEGFNPLKSDDPSEFEDFIANTCKGLLIKVRHDFESSDCEICDDLGFSAGVRIEPPSEDEIDDTDTEG